MNIDLASPPLLTLKLFFVFEEGSVGVEGGIPGLGDRLGGKPALDVAGASITSPNLLCTSEQVQLLWELLGPNL